MRIQIYNWAVCPSFTSLGSQAESKDATIFLELHLLQEACTGHWKGTEAPTESSWTVQTYRHFMGSY